MLKNSNRMNSYEIYLGVRTRYNNMVHGPFVYDYNNNYYCDNSRWVFSLSTYLSLSGYECILRALLTLPLSRVRNPIKIYIRFLINTL
jgi:hypothetical protein